MFFRPLCEYVNFGSIVIIIDIGATNNTCGKAVQMLTQKLLPNDDFYGKSLDNKRFISIFADENN